MLFCTFRTLHSYPMYCFPDKQPNGEKCSTCIWIISRLGCLFRKKQMGPLRETHEKALTHRENPLYFVYSCILLHADLFDSHLQLKKNSTRQIIKLNSGLPPFRPPTFSPGSYKVMLNGHLNFLVMLHRNSIFWRVLFSRKPIIRVITWK